MTEDSADTAAPAAAAAPAASTAVAGTPLGILVAGVGGQGAATAAQLLAQAALGSKLHAAVLETRGLAQRGGIVTTHVRIAAHPHFAPRCPPALTHAVIGLEPVETVRAARGCPSASVLAVGRAILPTGVFHDAYPTAADLERELRATHPRVAVLEAAGVTGPPNVFALGALAALGAAGVTWSALRAVVAGKLGARGADDLDRGRAAVETAGLLDAWRPHVPDLTALVPAP